MVAKIVTHSKGILIADSETAGLTATRLRQLLGTTVSWVSRSSFLVPIQSAHALLHVFPPENCLWDTKLLELAYRQVSKRQAQLRAHVEVAQAIENAKTELEDYSLAGMLDDHQIQAVAAISIPSLQGMALFDEQGTGKTVMALCGFDRLKQKNIIDRLIIICPKSVLSSWKNDIEMLFADRYVFKIAVGSAKERRKAILEHQDILALTYEVAVRERGLLTAVLSGGNARYMLIVDESYYAKNPLAVRTEAIVALRPHCDRALVLCGTPAPNSPRDLVQQVSIADEGLAFGNRDIPEDKESAYEAVSHALGDVIYLRRLKQEVFPNLPGKEIERVIFDLQPVQRTLYEHCRDELILAVRSIDDVQFNRHLASFIVRRSTLLQICSHPGAVDPTYEETPAKHLVLDNLLRQLVERQGQKVVIWSYFRHSLQSLADRYSSYGVARIDGSITSLNDRVQAISSFQHDPDTMLFLGNPAAAGMGITLTAANHAVYESLSNQAAHYMQSVDRIHRRGQEKDVTYHVLLAHDTIEEREFDSILGKERSSRRLLGDRYEEPMTRERFLTELGSVG